MPGRSDHVRWCWVDRWYTHSGWCLTVIFPVSCRPILGVVNNSIFTALQNLWIPTLDGPGHYKKGLQATWLGTASHLSTISLPNITTCDQTSQVFPSTFVHILYCKRLNAGGGNGLETRLTYSTVGHHPLCVYHLSTQYQRMWCTRPILHSLLATKLGQAPAKSYTEHMKHPQAKSHDSKTALFGVAPLIITAIPQQLSFETRCVRR